MGNKCKMGVEGGYKKMFKILLPKMGGNRMRGDSETINAKNLSLVAPSFVYRLPHTD